MNSRDGSAAKWDSSHFHIRCSDGLRTFCLLCTDIARAISVHIRQPVREQPDTGYRKWLLSHFAADPGFEAGITAGKMDGERNRNVDAKRGWIVYWNYGKMK